MKVFELRYIFSQITFNFIVENKWTHNKLQEDKLITQIELQLYRNRCIGTALYEYTYRLSKKEQTFSSVH